MPKRGKKADGNEEDLLSKLSEEGSLCVDSSSAASSKMPAKGKAKSKSKAKAKSNPAKAKVKAEPKSPSVRSSQKRPATSAQDLISRGVAVPEHQSSYANVHRYYKRIPKGEETLWDMAVRPWDETKKPKGKNSKRMKLELDPDAPLPDENEPLTTFERFALHGPPFEDRKVPIQATPETTVNTTSNGAASSSAPPPSYTPPTTNDNTSVDEDELTRLLSGEAPSPKPVANVGAQVKLDANGNIIIDESTLNVDISQALQPQPKRSDPNNAEHGFVPPGRKLPKPVKVTHWTQQEMDQLYRALSVCGEDPTLIQAQIPTRTLKQVSKKLKMEAKTKSQRWLDAFSGTAQKKIDVQEFKDSANWQLRQIKKVDWQPSVSSSEPSLDLVKAQREADMADTFLQEFGYDESKEYDDALDLLDNF